MGVLKNDERFNELIKAIKVSKQSRINKAGIINYLVGVRERQRNNDFFEDEFLERVVLEVINCNTYDDDNGLIKYFNELISRVKFLFPYGMMTDDYDYLKDLFINSISGNTDLFNEKLTSLFDNKRDYLDIMHIIDLSDLLIDQKEKVLDYGIQVARYCQNQDILKREIVSFIHGIKSCDDIEEYLKECLSEAKKKCGLYPIGEKTLSMISGEVEQAQSLMNKIENMHARVNECRGEVDAIISAGKRELSNAERDVTTLVNNGKRDIAIAGKEAITGLQDFVKGTKDDVIKRMDEYLEHLKGLLKIDSDKIFQETIIEATNKVNEFRLVAKGVTATAADELIRYQAACDEVFTKLKNYMENEPNLQHFLNTPELSDMISFFRLNKGNIINLAKEKPAKKEENKEESAPQEEAQEIKTDGVQTKVSTFYIPGNDRIIVPMNGQVILPGTVNRKVLRAFDRTIPFEVRLKEILDKKAKLEKKGVKFHELTEEIIRDVMEGDWLYLWGPSGCGKSYVIQQVADLIGIDVVENQKISRDYSVLGYNDPHGRFRATQTFAAALYGRMIFYDEFDSDNVIAQVVLNPLYSKLKNVIANPSKEQFYQFGEDMNISINPNMRMISAGNTSGNVIESEVWNARGKIDESLLQRLTPKKLYYDDKLERSLFGNNDGWYKLFVKFRKICDAYANEETDEEDMPQGVLTTRDAQDIATYIQNNSKSVDQIMREKFVQIKDNNYLNYIVAHLPQYTVTEREMEQSERALKEYDENALTKRLIYACNRAKNGIR